MQVVEMRMLRWFKHVKRKLTKDLVKRCERLTMVGLWRGRGRLKKYCKEVIRQDNDTSSAC